MDFTASELMAVSGARELEDRQVVAVGIGLPMVASFLAKKSHAPNMTILFELGVIDPDRFIPVWDCRPQGMVSGQGASSFVDILGTVCIAVGSMSDFWEGLESRPVMAI